MPLIDYREVRRMIPLRRVLDFLGVFSLHPVRGVYRGACPLGCGQGRNVATFDFARNLWYCHRCKTGGNQLDLWVRAREYQMWEGAVSLCIAAGLPVPWIVGSDSPPKLLLNRDDEWPP